MLDRRLKRWPNIDPTLRQRLLFDELPLLTLLSE